MSAYLKVTVIARSPLSSCKRAGEAWAVIRLCSVDSRIQQDAVFCRCTHDSPGLELQSVAPNQLVTTGAEGFFDVSHPMAGACSHAVLTSWLHHLPPPMLLLSMLSRM